MRLIGHSDQAGRSDGQQIMVRNGYAYIGHVCSKGFSVIDVRDPDQAEGRRLCPEPAEHLEPASAGPRRPAAARAWPRHVLASRNGGRAQLLQAAVRHARRACRPTQRATGRPEWRCSTFPSPTAPRQIGFMAVEGAGLHRIWYVGGRWAYASAMIDGFSDYILVIIDMADPTKPRDRRPLLAAGHESRGRRDGELAARTRPLRPAPRGRRRRHRLLRLARRLPRERRRVRQGQSEAHRPSRSGRRRSAAARTIACRCQTGIC